MVYIRVANSVEKFIEIDSIGKIMILSLSYRKITYPKIMIKFKKDRSDNGKKLNGCFEEARESDNNFRMVW